VQPLHESNDQDAVYICSKHLYVVIDTISFYILRLVTPVAHIKQVLDRDKLFQQYSGIEEVIFFKFYCTKKFTNELNKFYFPLICFGS